MSNISINDDYKIIDKLHASQSTAPGPKGWVQMYIHNNPTELGYACVDKSNLIVAKGREFVAQKLFELATTEDATTRPEFFNYKISHFSIGGAGAIVNTDDITLSGPLLSDSHIYKPIGLGNEIYLNEPSNYTDPTNPVYSYENSVKPIATHGAMELIAVQYDDSPDYYSTIKCSCTIPAGEPSILNPGESVSISEAGLYMVNSSLADTDPNKAHLFAHVCFSPKWVELESTITINWYILC